MNNIHCGFWGGQLQDLADGFDRLLTFDGDVESTFMRNFTATIESFGEIVEVPLKTDGQNILLTNENREGIRIFHALGAHEDKSL